MPSDRPAVILASMLAVAGLLAACTTQTAPPPTPEAPAEAQLPAVDTTGAQGLLSPDETLRTVSIPPEGSTEVGGDVVGYTSDAWAVPVAANQTLEVEYRPSNANLYMNIHDTADQSGAAVYRGEVDGNTATLTPATDTTYLVRPYQPRAMARRDEAGSYRLFFRLR